MNEETKQRIEKEATTASQQRLSSEVPPSAIYRWGYIAGATAEHDRIPELLRQERNKAIDDCKEIFNSLTGLTSYKILIEKFESLKSQPEAT